ncbi:MAG: regulatory iron-sulfur-containing complex subunit RicT [Spirochaetota bacterium]
MDLDIARVRFQYHVGKFRYDESIGLVPGDKCIVNTEEGQEIGTILNFSKVADVNTELLVYFDESGRVQNGYADKDAEGSDERRGRFNGPQNADRKAVPRVKNDPHKIYELVRKATADDLTKDAENEKLALEAAKICREKITAHTLEMKLVGAHYYFDRSKLLFEFIAEHRVDFRELVKDLAGHFRTRIDLRQIGVRDEAKIVGGCGVCGRDLCCNCMKSDFEAISIKMARDQNLSLNTAKISGLCGRLMCCLAYEHKTYCELKHDLPRIGDTVVYNEVRARVRDINLLSKQVLIDTEDDRQLYVKVEELTRHGVPAPERKEETAVPDAPA